MKVLGRQPAAGQNNSKFYYPTVNHCQGIARFAKLEPRII
jgi:hypothetical protein